MPKFPDVPKNHWGHRDAEDMADWGLMGGFPDGTFRPDEPLTRIQAASIIRRLLESDPENRMILRAMPSLVFISTPFSRGSGAFVAPWTVLTNAHVVSLQPGDTGGQVGVWGNPGYGFSPLDAMEGTVVHIRHDLDLAVLAVEKPFYNVECKPIGLGDREPDQGDWIWALGNPFGDPWDVTRGIIRSKERRKNYWSVSQAVWGTDAAVNPGNSGGILMDVRGRMVGVPSAGRMDANNYTFAIPLGDVRTVLKEAGLS